MSVFSGQSGFNIDKAAEAGLALSRQRLARVTREVEGLHTHTVEESDVYHAAKRVLTGGVEPKLEKRFRSAFRRVTWDTVDLYILQDNEECTRSQQQTAPPT